MLHGPNLKTLRENSPALKLLNPSLGDTFQAQPFFSEV